MQHTRPNHPFCRRVAAEPRLHEISDIQFQGNLLVTLGCGERGPPSWAMAPLRTNVRKEASDGASIAFHGVTSDQRPACGHGGIPDRHTTRAADHGPRVQLQGGDQAGGRPTGQGAAAAAWQRRPRNEMKANNNWPTMCCFSTSRTSHRARSERQQRSHRRRS